jgi:hypothetical protein
MTERHRRLGLLFLLAADMLISGSSLRIDRLDASLIQDSNVFETMDSTRNDLSGRFMLLVSAGYRLTHGQVLDFQYSGGLEAYSRFKEENRSVHHSTLAYTWQASRQINIGLAAEGRLRQFFEAERGYRWLKSGGSAALRLPWGFALTGYSFRAWMTHQGSSWFDFESQSDGVVLACRIDHSLKGFAGYHTELQKLHRPAYDYYYYTPTFADWKVREDDQENLIREVSMGLEWTRWMVVQIQVRYQRLFSNSYGYAYEQPSLEFTGARTLPWELTFRMFGRMQIKTYEDDMAPLGPLYPDTESEENQALCFDLIRDLISKTSLRIRWAWYRNESPIRDLYYEKTSISIGISQYF